MRIHSLPFELARSSHVSLPQQLVQGVVRAIRAGVFSRGAALPGSRTLARQLGVHRNTVIAAFEELEAQGWVEPAQGSGTRVSQELPLPADLPVARRTEQLGFGLRATPTSARRFEALPPRVLDFSAGLPDPRLFDVTALARAYRRALKLSRGRLLDFADPAGDERLRTALAAQVSARRGLAVSADELVITRGSQLAVHLLALALVRPGDAVAVESPGFPSFREAFAALGARLVPIPVDAEGLVTRRLLAVRRRLAAVVVTPHVQDPTTSTLSARRRLELLEFARTRRVPIVELDPDFEFSFDGPPVLPLASQDHAGVCLYVGTLSRALAPGLRTGFVVAPRALREQLLAIRAHVDRTGDPALERALAEMLEDGEVQRHSLKAKRVFTARRALLAGLLRHHLGAELDVTLPRAGLGLWLPVTRGIDVDAWAARALSEGVRVFPGSAFTWPPGELQALRLGFAHLNEAELEAAVLRLARSLPGRGRRRR